MAGFRVLWANEFIPAAIDTYRVNHPDTVLDTRDIRQIQPQEILTAINKQSGELDILDGSPPCASFSTSGKREKGWGKVRSYSDTKQRVDDLFSEYIRILRGLKPKVFVAENVSGLIKGIAKGHFLQILQELKSGYRVIAKLLDAAWLGVPQHRQRLIFVGVREDLKLDPQHPAPLKYQYSVNDALPEIKRYQAGGKPDLWKSATEAYGTVTADGASLSQTAYLSTNGFIETDNAIKRKFTIPELKRICSFPDDFQLTGTYEQQWERLGRAVPPVMMQHIAMTIRDEILCKIHS
jgi:DNA (cytosine-5)-methyltransferase 1